MWIWINIVICFVVCWVGMRIVGVFYIWVFFIIRVIRLVFCCGLVRVLLLVCIWIFGMVYLFFLRIGSV